MTILLFYNIEIIVSTVPTYYFKLSRLDIVRRKQLCIKVNFLYNI